MFDLGTGRGDETSRVATQETDDAPAVTPSRLRYYEDKVRVQRSQAFRRAFSRAIAAARDAVRHRPAALALAHLSDRQLNDVGLTRADVFAADLGVPVTTRARHQAERSAGAQGSEPGFVARIVRALSQRLRQNADIRHLKALDDAHLRDIGLTRDTIEAAVHGNYDRPDTAPRRRTQTAKAPYPRRRGAGRKARTARTERPRERLGANRARRRTAMTLAHLSRTAIPVLLAIVAL